MVRSSKQTAKELSISSARQQSGATKVEKLQTPRIIITDFEFKRRAI